MKVGFIGWRGMVGSVLMQRMREENDFAHIPEAHFFTTSNVGGAAPDFGQANKTLLDANNVAELARRRLHQIRARIPARKRLEWLLDRRCIHLTHERQRHHRARPRKPQRD